VALSRAVFLDKDGTLVVDVPYNVDPALVRLTPGAPAALRRLHSAGFKLVVISNQSGIGRGYYSEAALEVAWDALQTLLSTEGAAVDAFYYCPHAPADGCECRKPGVALFERAAADLGIDLRASWMVGDILEDVEGGHRAGCQSILLDRTGRVTAEIGDPRSPDAIVSDLVQAATIILERSP
jgi:histidinol-phosphate phosphatase family protein